MEKHASNKLADRVTAFLASTRFYPQLVTLGSRLKLAVSTPLTYTNQHQQRLFLVGFLVGYYHA